MCRPSIMGLKSDSEPRTRRPTTARNQRAAIRRRTTKPFSKSPRRNIAAAKSKKAPVKPQVVNKPAKKAPQSKGESCDKLNHSLAVAAAAAVPAYCTSSRYTDESSSDSDSDSDTDDDEETVSVNEDGKGKAAPSVVGRKFFKTGITATSGGCERRVAFRRNNTTSPQPCSSSSLRMETYVPVRKPSPVEPVSDEEMPGCSYSYDMEMDSLTDAEVISVFSQLDDPVAGCSKDLMKDDPLFNRLNKSKMEVMDENSSSSDSSSSEVESSNKTTLCKTKKAKSGPVDPFCMKRTMMAMSAAAGIVLSGGGGIKMSNPPASPGPSTPQKAACSPTPVPSPIDQLDQENEKLHTAEPKLKAVNKTAKGPSAPSEDSNSNAKCVLTKSLETMNKSLKTYRPSSPDISTLAPTRKLKKGFKHIDKIKSASARTLSPDINADYKLHETAKRKIGKKAAGKPTSVSNISQDTNSENQEKRVVKKKADVLNYDTSVPSPDINPTYNSLERREKKATKKPLQTVGKSANVSIPSSDINVDNKSSENNETKIIKKHIIQNVNKSTSASVPSLDINATCTSPENKERKLVKKPFQNASKSTNTSVSSPDINAAYIPSENNDKKLVKKPFHNVSESTNASGFSPDIIASNMSSENIVKKMVKKPFKNVSKPANASVPSPEINAAYTSSENNEKKVAKKPFKNVSKSVNVPVSSPEINAAYVSSDNNEKKVTKKPLKNVSKSTYTSVPSPDINAAYMSSEKSKRNSVKKAKLETLSKSSSTSARSSPDITASFKSTEKKPKKTVSKPVEEVSRPSNASISSPDINADNKCTEKELKKFTAGKELESDSKSTNAPSLSPTFSSSCDSNEMNKDSKGIAKTPCTKAKSEEFPPLSPDISPPYKSKSQEKEAKKTAVSKWLELSCSTDTTSSPVTSYNNEAAMKSLEVGVKSTGGNTISFDSNNCYNNEDHNSSQKTSGSVVKMIPKHKSAFYTMLQETVEMETTQVGKQNKFVETNNTISPTVSPSKIAAETKKGRNKVSAEPKKKAKSVPAAKVVRPAIMAQVLKNKEAKAAAAAAATATTSNQSDKTTTSTLSPPFRTYSADSMASKAVSTNLTTTKTVQSSPSPKSSVISNFEALKNRFAEQEKKKAEAVVNEPVTKPHTPVYAIKSKPIPIDNATPVNVADKKKSITPKAATLKTAKAPSQKATLPKATPPKKNPPKATPPKTKKSPKPYTMDTATEKSINETINSVVQVAYKNDEIVSKKTNGRPSSPDICSPFVYSGVSMGHSKPHSSGNVVILGGKANSPTKWESHISENFPLSKFSLNSNDIGSSKDQERPVSPASNSSTIGSEPSLRDLDSDSDDLLSIPDVSLPPLEIRCMDKLGPYFDATSLPGYHHDDKKGVSKRGGRISGRGRGGRR